MRRYLIISLSLLFLAITVASGTNITYPCNLDGYIYGGKFLTSNWSAYPSAEYDEDDSYQRLFQVDNEGNPVDATPINIDALAQYHFGLNVSLDAMHIDDVLYLIGRAHVKLIADAHNKNNFNFHTSQTILQYGISLRCFKRYEINYNRYYGYIVDQPYSDNAYYDLLEVKLYFSKQLSNFF